MAGQLVQLGYYDQHLKILDDSKPAIRAIWPEGDPDATEQQMCNLLGRFGLTGDQVYQQVGATRYVDIAGFPGRTVGLAPDTSASLRSSVPTR